MGGLKCLLLLLFFNHTINGELNLTPRNPVFDPKFYEDALDPELCEKQLSYISQNAKLRFQFLDTGIRLPKYLAAGNTYDFGSYHECLSIQQEAEDSVIDGKYCMINVPLEQQLNQHIYNEMTSIPDWLALYPNITSFIHNEDLIKYETIRQRMRIELGVDFPERDIGGNFDVPVHSLNLGMCLPKSCTTKRALETLYGNVTAIGLQHTDNYCRLPHDKTWVPADTVSTTLLTVLAIITILSTSYDVYNTVIMKRDPKTLGTLRKSFSVYTNTKRLFTFNTVPGTIECIDGIRAFAMVWVILGHTFASINTEHVIANISDALNWTVSVESLWFMSSPITVDTFFALSGILVVYTNAGKITGLKFLKKLHLFYLHRLLRLFPILAFTIVLYISVLNRMADGPYWTHVASSVEACRIYWWSALLHLQNYLNPMQKCITPTWYISVDMQLHFICPIILFWVLTNNKKYAWCSLIAGVIVSLTVASTYIFINKFPSARPTDPVEIANYIKFYYRNTLTRAPAFFVGMVFGYIIYINRDKKVHINKLLATFYWLTAAAVGSIVIYSTQYANERSGESSTMDSLINAFTRPAWAACIGWLIFACTHGYGGIINWVLCLSEIKLFSRISYAMYIVHYPVMVIFVGSAVSPFYFDVPAWVYMFFGHFGLSFVLGIIVTVLVDSPASILIKHCLGGPKKSQAAVVKVVETNGDQEKIEKS